MPRNTPAAPPAPVLSSAKTDDRPWWRYGHVWLVIGGPAVVVAASLVTVVVAVRSPDPVLAGDAYRQGVRIDPAAAPAQEGARALMPAVQGRNHAVSPSPPPQRSNLRESRESN